jgi:hypothetical protein
MVTRQDTNHAQHYITLAIADGYLRYLPITKFHREIDSFMKLIPRTSDQVECFIPYPMKSSFPLRFCTSSEVDAKHNFVHLPLVVLQQ